MNIRTIVFEKLIKLDKKLIEKNEKLYEKTGDSKYLEKIKKIEAHLKDQEKNVERFR